jgi:hypothetical protein
LMAAAAAAAAAAAVTAARARRHRGQGSGPAAAARRAQRAPGGPRCCARRPGAARRSPGVGGAGGSGNRGQAVAVLVAAVSQGRGAHSQRGDWAARWGRRSGAAEGWCAGGRDCRNTPGQRLAAQRMEGA